MILSLSHSGDKIGTETVGLQEGSDSIIPHVLSVSDSGSWLRLHLTVERKGPGALEKLPGLSHGLRWPGIKASWDVSLAVVCFRCPLRNMQTVPDPRDGLSEQCSSLPGASTSSTWD